MAWSEETHAALLVRNAVQQFQAGFAEKPKEIPFPEPPEWGHTEVAAEKRDAETRRLRRFTEKHG